MTGVATRRTLPPGRTFALLLACVLVFPGCLSVLYDLQSTRLRLEKLFARRKAALPRPRQLRLCGEAE